MPALRVNDFEWGDPFPLAFAAPLEPKEVQSKFGAPQMMFSSSAGSIYLDAEHARQIAEAIANQGIQPGEPVRVTKTKAGRGGIRFTVERERQPAFPTNGNGNGHGAGYSAPPAAPPPYPSEPVSGSVQAISAKMMACFMAAIDAVAEAQTYADRRGLKVTFTSEDVRSCAISCYIQCEKGSR